MVIAAASRRAGRAGRSVAAESGDPGRRQRPLKRHGWAAATQDRFLDAVVLLCVLTFLALAAGIGVLVLQATWPR
ncbi:MAG TPA: hypothetical protein VHO01_09520 [Jatrophihabitans sp.]|nr:hypothetical protein [Jatrophihabitans sp.]